MKQKLLVIATVAALTALTSTSRADTYNDATGENFNATGILDITSVEVTNTATDMVLKIKFAGNPVATDWGKYMIGLQVTNAGNVFDTASNGWGRPISIDPGAGPSGGMDYWIGSWADSGNGAELRKYTGAWALQSATYNPNPDGLSITKNTNSVTINFAYSGLGVAFGDTIFFDVYTSGGGGTDSAVDALSRSTQSISDWGVAFVSTNLLSYTLQTVTAIPHNVKFTVDMGVQGFEFTNAVNDGFKVGPQADGITPFRTPDVVYVRGSFNGYGGTDALVRQGDTMIYTNTVNFLATPGDTIQYKFEGVSFPGYETTILAGGGNRTLTLTNTTMTAPFACFGDRCLTNPPVSTVNFAVDMGLAKQFGVFDESTNWVVLRGTFNSWGETPMTQGAPPNTNIYSSALTYSYYPLNPANVGFYKAYITNLANPYRDNGWEAPISNGGGNRAFAINSAVQTLAFIYNDENPVINASIEPLNGTDVKISFNSFPPRGGFPGYPTGGVYAVESRATLSSPWSTNAIIYSTNATSSITNTGVLPGTPSQFYRVGLIGL